MKTAADYHIVEIETIVLNGKRVKAFKAFVRRPDEFGRDQFIFESSYTAPAKTANKNLWMHCESDASGAR